MIAIDPACPDPTVADLELTVTADGGYSSVHRLQVFIGDTPGFTDACEAGEGQWSHRPVIPAYVDDWHMETYRAHSGSTCWKAGGEADDPYHDLSTSGLITPPFMLPPNAQLSFWHWLDLSWSSDADSAVDGAVVMISSGDGNWTPIPPVGGYPYATTVYLPNYVSPFDEGTPCYSGSSDWSEAVFDLSAYSGVVQLMFYLGADGMYNGEGWYIDDVLVASAGCCDIRGDCDNNGTRDISDLTFLVDFMFGGGPEPPCAEQGDIDGNSVQDISDITYFVDYMFGGGPPLPPCPY